MIKYEHCAECGALTGRAGKGGDSYYYSSEGPLCEDCADSWPEKMVSERNKLRAELAALKAKAAVPDGHALIPARIELSPEDIACIMLQCGGDEEATEIDEQFNGGVLWVGSLRDDDGSETYGLHIACVGYLEEGSTTIAEFEAAPAQPQDKEEPTYDA